MSFSSKSLDASCVLCLRGDTLAFPWAAPCIIYPSGGSPMVSISHTLFFYCLTFCPPLSIGFPFLCLVLFHYLCSSWDGVQVYVNNSHALSYYVLYKTTLNSDRKMGVDFRRTIKARAPSRTSVHPLAVPAAWSSAAKLPWMQCCGTRRLPFAMTRECFALCPDYRHGSLKAARGIIYSGVWSPRSRFGETLLWQEAEGPDLKIVMHRIS